MRRAASAVADCRTAKPNCTIQTTPDRAERSFTSRRRHGLPEVPRPAAMHPLVTSFQLTAVVHARGRGGWIVILVDLMLISLVTLRHVASTLPMSLFGSGMSRREQLAISRDTQRGPRFATSVALDRCQSGRAGSGRSGAACPQSRTRPGSIASDPWRNHCATSDRCHGSR